jgi:hypothetical protein
LPSPAVREQILGLAIEQERPAGAVRDLEPVQEPAILETLRVMRRVPTLEVLERHVLERQAFRLLRRLFPRVKEDTSQ